MTFIVALTFMLTGLVIILSARNNQTITEYLRGLQ